MVLEKLDVHMEIKEPEVLTYTKINLKFIINMMNANTINILEEYIGERLRLLGIGKDSLYRGKKAQTTKGRN